MADAAPPTPAAVVVDESSLAAADSNQMPMNRALPLQDMVPSPPSRRRKPWRSPRLLPQPHQQLW
jgi:hypothetical protein